MSAASLGPEARPDIIDAPLLRVPLESLKRAAKERKAAVDDAGEALAAAAAQLGAACAAEPAASDHTPAAAHGYANGSQQQQQQQLAQLDQLVERLQGLKRKLGGVSRQEAGDAGRVRARLEHVVQLGAPARGGVVGWHAQRLDRLLVDHMLRSGNTASAARLAAEVGCEELSELHIFAEVAPVVAALKARDCGPALAWCADNRARLRKAKSSLEFRLRLQEFLELVRQGQRLGAVAYARAHLAPWAAQHLRDLQRALATLAFGADSKVPAYRALFSDAAWTALLDAFHRELFRLHCLMPESSLAVHLQAGLVALHNPPPASSSSREDPLHHPDFRALAAGLPFAKHVHSKLICAVTRQIMTDANPPLVLPNGYVYSQAGVDALAARNGGRIVCPRTGAEYGYDEARRAYIV